MGHAAKAAALSTRVCKSKFFAFTDSVMLCVVFGITRVVLTAIRKELPGSTDSPEPA